ncbi:DUF1987 domain-containing protein [Plebeiibacterium marinum]|uniref:DUF1987 domain-containing protein n=1 Tax=Plebeiibacterium marinum TaxID=2992111 RepID=A0AAE3SKY9_9BACT|nr:DUF1987 domain-containing protein [Plebeiobacterium marinum]MCW3807142.1 DUF1987 domain-containing protein [Plebeiobacterium marinum]
MKTIHLEPTKTSPQITLDADHGIIEMKGNIISLDTSAIFDPIFNWINKYLNNPKDKTTIKINLEYLNTIGSKYLLILFRKLEGLPKRGNEVTIQWAYDQDDEDTLELIEDYKNLLHINFELIESN